MNKVVFKEIIDRVGNRLVLSMLSEVGGNENQAD
jgi:hypothetical protein